MKKFKIYFLYGVLALAICACADRKSSKSIMELQKLPQSKPVGREPDKVSDHNERPEKFYSKFFFRTTESCSEIRYTLTSSDTFLVGRDDLGRVVKGRIELMILPSRAFYVYYEETAVKNYLQYGYEGVRVVDKIIRGDWQIRNDLLVLNGVGYASGIELDGRKIFQLTVDQNLNTAGLAGKPLLLYHGTSTRVLVPDLDRCRR